MEVPELPPLQGVTHVRRLLLSGQGVLPNVDAAPPAHRQHACLADVTPGGGAGGEVGVQGLVGAQVPHPHLPIRTSSHQAVSNDVGCQRQNWTLQAASDALSRG